MGKGTLESDTYEVRRAEGRPKHGTNSLAIIGFSIFLWFLHLIAIMMPEWRSNWLGVLGYPYRRAWGIFTITGQATRFHHEVMTDTCRFFAQLNVVGVCASPICLWYRTKCQVYMDTMLISYATGFFFLLALIVHALCIIWTMRMTPRMIRWAATWWCACVLLHICTSMFWFIMTEEMFGILDAEALYPQPSFSFCFYCECIVMFGLIIIAFQGVTLMATWPEPESDSSTTSDDDDDDYSDLSDADYDQGNDKAWGKGYDNKGMAKGMGKGMDKGMGKDMKGYGGWGPQPGYDPNYGPAPGY